MSFSRLILSKKILISNLEYQKRYCKNICAMVKADAYGMGLEFVCKTLKNKIDFFGVANLDEALKIRSFDKESKVLIVGFCENYYLSILNDISFTIQSEEDFNNLIKIIEKNEKNLKKYAKIAKIHLKINTGMNRLGISSIDELKKILKKYLNISLKNLIEIEGVSTHFASKKQLKRQENIFKNFIKYIPSLINPVIHFGGGLGENVAKNFPNSMLRVGLNLYIRPKKIFKLKSKIIKIFTLKSGEFLGYNCAYKAYKNVRVGIVPLGYADGINRKLSGSKILIKGKNYTIIGNICMDVFFVEVDENINIDDEVEIFNNLENFAKQCKTISYEILTSLNKDRLKVEKL